ncbi:MAG: hypothetical protein QOD55_966 [Solirubrobacteraceae bacterium]|jgi:hypothetical protein|nr:hypothetical protein [Solirubrobacteraceae bacterium]MEA2288969.1 hypothetical protein [Solirubrobacteraceae bacterium]
MHPAEHRALRELHVFARQLARHWDRLGGRMAGEAGPLLTAGAADAAALVRELGAAAAQRGVHGEPAAALAGRFASARPSSPDRLLERNQALRYALLDVQHCVTLLGYAAGLAATRGDEPLREICARWQERLTGHEAAVRAAVLALAGRPDEAIAPADPSPAGRLGQRIAAGAGALGEWVDGRAARRRR